MDDLFARGDREIDIVPAVKRAGRVAGTFVAAGDHFETQAIDALDVDFEGIKGDFHAGFTRRSGGREPWYPRGTQMRNERQLSIVAPDELAKVAHIMEIEDLRPEWIGANLALEGIADLSMLPGRTLLFFEGGVTLKVDGQNAPCKLAGSSVASHAGMADHKAGTLAFPKAAKRLRGLVAWVEKPGRITNGEAVSVRIPEQWIYRA